MATLDELNVQPGDEVRCFSTCIWPVGTQTVTKEGWVIDRDGVFWGPGAPETGRYPSHDGWEIVSRASDATDWSSWHLTPVGGGAPKVGDHKTAGLISDIEVTPLPCGKQYAYRFRVGGAECSPDAPKAWKDMTDEERAPILLAWARGEAIERLYLKRPGSEWKLSDAPPTGWVNDAYRIKPKAEPEPKRVERFFQVDYKSMAEALDVFDARRMVQDYGGYAYRITTDPDGGNATIEEVK